MSPRKLYFLLLGLIGLLFVGMVAGTYGTNSLLTAQADKLTGLKAKSMALSQEQLGLNKAKEEVKKYSNLEQITKVIVPEDKDQAEAVREIVNIAGQNNVSLASINFPASTLGSSNTPVGSSTSTPAPAADTPKPTTASSASSPLNALSQLTAVPNIPGVYELQIVVEGDPNKPVQYNSLLNFLTDLEHNRRTAQVSTITIAPSTANPNLLTFSLNLDEYIKP